VGSLTVGRKGFIRAALFFGSFLLGKLKRSGNPAQKRGKRNEQAEKTAGTARQITKIL
jgi:hypothetical protein